MGFGDDLVAFEEGARTALERQSDGREALDRLEWWEVAIGDRNRAAFAGLFIAEGKTLAITPALGAAIAAPAAREARGPSGLAWSAALAARPDPHGGSRILAPAGYREAEALVVELKPDELALVPASEVQPQGGEALDPGVGIAARVNPGAARVAISGDAARAVRTRMAAEGRLAAALTTLGACDSMLDLAREYAPARRQFGRPLSDFQAVSHMIAEAWLARTALERTCLAVLEEQPLDVGTEASLSLKALAGRVGRRVSALTLQVLGAIGFTWEHPHHRYWRRVQTLDALIETGAVATAALGRMIRRRRALGRPFGVEIEEVEDGQRS